MAKKPRSEWSDSYRKRIERAERRASSTDKAKLKTKAKAKAKGKSKASIAREGNLKYVTTVKLVNDGASVTSALKAAKLSPARFKKLNKKYGTFHHIETAQDAKKRVGKRAYTIALHTWPIIDTKGELHTTDTIFVGDELLKFYDYKDALEAARNNNDPNLLKPFRNLKLVDIHGNTIKPTTSLRTIKKAMNEMDEDTHQRFMEQGSDQAMVA
jgi:hypothetical protein